MLRFIVNWMVTKASWENAASFFSVRQDVGDIRLVHYMQQPPLKRPSTANLHYCLCRGTPTVISSPFTAEC